MRNVGDFSELGAIDGGDMGVFTEQPVENISIGGGWTPNKIQKPPKTPDPTAANMPTQSQPEKDAFEQSNAARQAIDATGGGTGTSLQQQNTQGDSGNGDGNPGDDKFVTRGELRSELRQVKSDIVADIKTLLDKRLPPPNS